MSRHKDGILIGPIDSMSRGVKSVTIYGTVVKGLASAIGRHTECTLDENSITFILSMLAGMPMYRDVFKIVADILDDRENGKTRASGFSYALDSPHTQSMIREAMLASIKKHINAREANRAD